MRAGGDERQKHATRYAQTKKWWPHTELKCTGVLFTNTDARMRSSTRKRRRRRRSSSVSLFSSLLSLHLRVRCSRRQRSCFVIAATIRRTFFLSLAGSLSALMTSADAVGTTLTFACLFCTVRQHVTLSPFHSFAVSFAMSSPIFFGLRPSGPIFGARDDAAPTSPPTARMYTYIT